MQEDQKPEFVFYLFLIISQIRERGNREFFRLISYLLDIRHRRSKRCRLGIVHRWTSTLETEHAKENGGTHEQKTLIHHLLWLVVGGSTCRPVEGVDQRGLRLECGTLVYWAMRCFGRVAFPVFALLVAEGLTRGQGAILPHAAWLRRGQRSAVAVAWRS